MAATTLTYNMAATTWTHHTYLQHGSHHMDIPYVPTTSVVKNIYFCKWNLWLNVSVFLYYLRREKVFKPVLHAVQYVQKCIWTDNFLKCLCTYQCYWIRQKSWSVYKQLHRYTNLGCLTFFCALSSNISSPLSSHLNASYKTFCPTEASKDQRHRTELQQDSSVSPQFN